MIIDASTGEITEDWLENQLCVKNMHCQSSFSGCKGVEDHKTNDPYIIPEIKFFFTDQYLSIIFGEKDISGHMEQLDFLFQSLRPTYRITNNSVDKLDFDVNNWAGIGDNVDHNVQQKNSNEAKNFISIWIDKAASDHLYQIPQEIFKLNFKERFAWYSLPLIRHIGIGNDDINSIITQFCNPNLIEITEEFIDQFKSKDFSELTYALVGSRSKIITKFLGNELASKDNSKYKISIPPSSIYGQQYSAYYTWFTLLKKVSFVNNLLSIDYVHKAIEDSLFPSIPDYIKEEHIVFLKTHYKEKRIYKLIQDGTHLLGDTIGQCKEYKTIEDIPKSMKSKYPNGIVLPRKPKCIKEMHDIVSRQYREIKAEETDANISYHSDEFKLHGFKSGDFEFILPCSGSDIVKYGQVLDHCIASYVEKASRKQCILLGIKKLGILTYNAEVFATYFDSDDKSLASIQIKQLRGYKNSNPTKHDWDIIEKMLADFMQNILNSSNSKPKDAIGKGITVNNLNINHQ